MIRGWRTWWAMGDKQPYHVTYLLTEEPVCTANQIKFRLFGESGYWLATVSEAPEWLRMGEIMAMRNRPKLTSLRRLETVLEDLL